jgi:hypothetical protein
MSTPCRTAWATITAHLESAYLSMDVPYRIVDPGWSLVCRAEEVEHSRSTLTC